MHHPVHALLLLPALALSGCTLFAPHEPLHFALAGLEPLPAQGMEVRFALVLRVQNPNNRAINYDGLALTLAVNGQPLASGVSDQAGQLPRYGESLLRVPLSISALAMMRQAWAAAGYQNARGLPYELRGKLATGVLGTTRFHDSGALNWPTHSKLH